MKILELHEKLQELYRLESQPSLQPYLFSVKSDESPKVVMKLEGEEVSLGVFIGKTTLDSIEKRGLHQIPLQQFLNVAEEISHFTYLCWAISNERELSLLDLELQGEIDKFLLAQQYFSDTDLYYTLFERFFLVSTLSQEERARYEEANRLGRKFCKALMTGEQGLSDLRKFYRQSSQSRLTWTQKL